MEKRVFSIFMAMMLMLLSVSVRLWYIMADGESDVSVSLENYSRRLNIAYRRGFIYDRNKNPIAGIKNGYITVVDASRAADAEVIARVSDMSLQSISAMIIKGKPFTVSTSEDISCSWAVSLPRYSRYLSSYPAVHIIGYLDANGNGVGGIEAAFNEYLEECGGEAVFRYSANARDRQLAGLIASVSDSGYSSLGGVTLTLDLELQKRLEGLSLEKGAAVVMDISSGEIVGCISRPSYSPDDLARYLDSTQGEFINRAFCAFTPGSLYKTVTACAALEADMGYADLIYFCDGSRCFEGIPHGDIDMKGAMAVSCNGYFVNIAREIGAAAIASMAERMGVGEDILSGFSYNAGSSYETVSENSAIGQGRVLVTPIEAARMYSAIANKGILPEPTIVKSLTLSDGTDAKYHIGESRRVISEDTALAVRNMLFSVIYKGIGGAAAPTVGRAIGKTATAQTGQYGEDGEEKLHSWFCGVYEGYAIAVLCEDAKAGKSPSAPIFSQICGFIWEELHSYGASGYSIGAVK